MSATSAPPKVTPAFYLHIIVAAIFLFYMYTAIVVTEGAHQTRFVLKPAPSFQNLYACGEEGAWARKNPGSDSPWWIREKYTTIYSEESEHNFPLWIKPYVYFGYFIKISAAACLLFCVYKLISFATTKLF